MKEMAVTSQCHKKVRRIILVASAEPLFFTLHDKSFPHENITEATNIMQRWEGCALLQIL
jgi:hypothetical protein